MICCMNSKAWFLKTGGNRDKFRVLWSDWSRIDNVINNLINNFIIIEIKNKYIINFIINHI
jgi:hypothetical protein